MQKNNFIIFGSGGHARSIADECEGEVAFIVKESSNASEIPEEEFFKQIDIYRNVPIYIGIGDNLIRKKIFKELIGYGIKPAIFISKGAFVAKSATFNEGAVILPAAVIGANAYIGQNTIVNSLSVVGHDSYIGNHTQITASVCLAGGVNVGENCFFGIRSAVIPGIIIGNNVIVLAGSLVTKNFTTPAKIGGSPARIIQLL